MGTDTFYDVLGVTRNATPSLLRAAYKARIRETHPDNGGDAQMAAEVNRAFETLIDEHRRYQYDLGLDDAPRRASESPSDTPREPSSSGAGESRPYPRIQTPVPSFKRPRLLRDLLIALSVWSVVAIVVCLLAHEQEETVASVQGGFVSIAPFLLAAAMTVLAISFLTRARAFLRILAMAYYVAVALGTGVGNHAVLGLIATIAFIVYIRLRLRFERRVDALKLVDEFWAAAAHPRITAWYVIRSSHDEQSSVVQIADLLNAGTPDSSAVVWGRIVSGSYIVTDLNSSPGQVLLSVSREQMAWAKKARR